MPARDHTGKCLPPAESHPDVMVDVREAAVHVLAINGHAESVRLTERQTRGLICELSAAWARAFSEGLR